MSSPPSAVGLLESLSSTYNFNFNLDFVRLICKRNMPAAVLSSIRSSIFSTAQATDLADKRASIVSRRGTSLNPLQQKLAEDVWDLANCVLSNKSVKVSCTRMGKEVPLILNLNGNVLVWATMLFKFQLAAKSVVVSIGLTALTQSLATTRILLQVQLFYLQCLPIVCLHLLQVQYFYLLP